MVSECSFFAVLNITEKSLSYRADMVIMGKPWKSGRGEEISSRVFFRCVGESKSHLFISNIRGLPRDSTRCATINSCFLMPTKSEEDANGALENKLPLSITNPTTEDMRKNLSESRDDACSIVSPL